MNNTVFSQIAHGIDIVNSGISCGVSFNWAVVYQRNGILYGHSGNIDSAGLCICNRTDGGYASAVCNIYCAVIGYISEGDNGVTATDGNSSVFNNIYGGGLINGCSVAVNFYCFRDDRSVFVSFNTHTVAVNGDATVVFNWALF